MLDDIRELTAQEVTAFHRNGWVHAPGLIGEKLANRILEQARRLMGTDAGRTSGAGGGDAEFADYSRILRNYLGAYRTHPLFAEVSHSEQLAKCVSRLIRNRSVRFFNDEILVKPPAEAGGEATPWHQDLPHTSFDRTGLVNIWIALVDLPEDGGSMSFLNGSHRFGPLGRTLLASEDALEQNPWLADECKLVPSIPMKAGDATIHGDLTVHGGQAYRGPHWRWAYLVNLMDASVRNVGGPSYGEPLGDLPANAPFPDERFPLIWPPSKPIDSEPCMP